MVHDSESWLPVVDYEGYYEVSDQGRVQSLDREIMRSDGKVKRFRGKLLAPQDDGRGYLNVTLSRDGKTHTYHIHKLVLDAFVGLCPEGRECLHGNDIGVDNRLENLRWDYHDVNQREMVANGHHYNANKTHCPQGHKYSAENTRILVRRNGSKQRRCLTCKRREGRIYQARKRANAT